MPSRSAAACSAIRRLRTEGRASAFSVAGSVDALAPVPRTFEPVSYTHLDVYKRQVNSLAGGLVHLVEQDSGKFVIGDLQRRGLTVLDLDVYKRQPPHFSSPPKR